MRMQFVPFPRMKPRQPSSRHIFARALPTGSLYSLWPALCTWYRIFNRSSGETTVLDTAPATPPPQKAATTGCETKSMKGVALTALEAALIASSEVCKKCVASQSLFLDRISPTISSRGWMGVRVIKERVPTYSCHLDGWDWRSRRVKFATRGRRLKAEPASHRC